MTIVSPTPAPSLETLAAATDTFLWSAADLIALPVRAGVLTHDGRLAQKGAHGHWFTAGNTLPRTPDDLLAGGWVKVVFHPTQEAL